MSPAEYNRCVDIHSDAVYRFLLSNDLDEDTSRDLVQDAFETLWRNIERVTFEKGRSYLFTTAYHDMIDLKRKSKRTKELEFDEGAFEVPREIFDARIIINVGLSKLSEVQRSVLLLRDFEGYDYREIGEITGLNESQVKVYIFRARQIMKQFLVKKENVL